jgi:outer membrane receptor for monomeric catechols
MVQAFLLIGLLLTSLTASAQAGRIVGVATDPHGAVVAGASVTLTNVATSASSSITTSGQGDYVFQPVSAGIYRIEIQAKGFKHLIIENVSVAAGESVSRDFALTMGANTETVTVEGAHDGEENYIVTQNFTGAKADLPITDIAQDIVIIPQLILQEQNLDHLDEALKNVAGYSESGSAGYYYGNYANLRGFDVSNFMKDGLYDETNASNIPYLGNVEQVEVMKGPSALLYGTPWGSLGGEVNIITKKPEIQPFYTFGYSTDSYGAIKSWADLNQPLGRNWSARLIADGTDGKTFITKFDPVAWNVTLGIAGKLTSKATINLSAERLSLEQPTYGSIWVWEYTSSGKPVPFPTRFPYGFNDYLHSDNATNSERIAATLNYRFNYAWNLRVTGEGNCSTSRSHEFYPLYLFNLGAGNFYNFD